MDQLGTMLNSLGSSDSFNTIMKLLPAGLGVAGTVGNIGANRARNQVLSSEMAQMRNLENLTPAQVTSGITGLEQPLSRDLINNVTNGVQGQLASRGLSQAPGIFASSLAQGLAPYQLQEQQLAQQAFFQKLGLPISARPSPFGPFPQSTNTSQIWQMLMQRFMNPNGTGALNFNPNTTGSQIGPTDFPVNSQGGELPTGLPPDLINFFLGSGGGLTPSPSTGDTGVTE